MNEDPPLLPNDLPLPNPFSPQDVQQILKDRSWSPDPPSSEQVAWIERATALLGPQAADLAAFAELLSLVFHYDAHQVLETIDAHVVLSRYAARDVVRQLALLLLENGALTTNRFREIVTSLKESLGMRGRELFHPLRLALAGRSGEGGLDRVILLLDEAASAFPERVKTARERIVEFCAALD